MPRVCPRVPPRGKRQLRGGPTRGLSRMHTTRLPPTPTPVSYVHGHVWRLCVRASLSVRVRGAISVKQFDARGIEKQKLMQGHAGAPYM